MSLVLKKRDERVLHDFAHFVVVYVGVVVVDVLVREGLDDIHCKVDTLGQILFFTPRSANLLAMASVISSSRDINLLLTASSLCDKE